MGITRRNFFGLAAGAALISKNLLKAEGRIPTRQLLEETYISPVNSKMILPPALKEGSKIAITAPASPTSMGELAACIKLMNKMGCKVEIGDTIKNYKTQYRYLSSSDSERAEEFMHYIEKEDIDAIFCARGGYGVLRILPLLDYNAIRNNPKIVMGFSDITGLINAIYRKTNIVSFHGPLASSSFDKETVKSVVDMLFEEEEFKPVKYRFKDIEVINEGSASGRLVGGNLSIVVATLGTPYEIDTDNAILLLEETSEEPYKIDRMLTQLWLAGKLQKCAGIVFGCFNNLDAKRHFYPGWSFTVRQIIESRIIPLEIPAIMGVPFGHVKNNLTLPIGTLAEFDGRKKTFSILEKPVKNYD